MPQKMRLGTAAGLQVCSWPPTGVMDKIIMKGVHNKTASIIIPYINLRYVYTWDIVYHSSHAISTSLYRAGKDAEKDNQDCQMAEHLFGKARLKHRGFLSL